MDILSKLGAVFDKLNPVESTMTAMQGKRAELINQVRYRQSDLGALKEKICKEIATQNPYED